MKSLAIISTPYQLMSVYLFINESSKQASDFIIILPNNKKKIVSIKK